MKVAIFVLPSVPATHEERRALRPIGRDNERHQAMLAGLRKLAVGCEAIGVEVFCLSEHHFQSEGYEVSPSPMLTLMDLAARTTRMKMCPLGRVLPMNDPIRVAEDMAVMDHLLAGRFIAGFARGFQDREVNVLGQQFRVTSAPMDGSALDKHNRDVFEEHFALIKKAWTEDAIDWNGKYYQVPFPRDAGIARWPAGAATRAMGASGEIDEAGAVRKISVVPKPYQKPHPPIWQPFAASADTVRFAAREDVVPCIVVPDKGAFVQSCRLYEETAAKTGHVHALGRNVGAVRFVHFGETTEQATALLERTTFRLFRDWLGMFGFFELMRLPDDPPGPLPPGAWSAERMFRSGLAIAGTPAEVRAELESLRTVHGEGGNLEWLCWFFDNTTPWPETERQLAWMEREIRHFKQFD